MEKNITKFETGATSSAVNELILFTDNTRSLVDLRDRIYDSYKDDDMPGIWDIQPLLYAAQREYRAQMEHEDNDVSHIRFMVKELRDEYCQIYANRFAEWKKEKERNSK